MIWLDDIYDIRYNRHYPYFGYDELAEQSDIAFRLYDDKTGRYESVNIDGLIQYVVRVGVIGVEPVFRGRSVMAFSAYAYNAVDRKICDCLDCDGVYESFEVTMLDTLVRGTSNADSIQLYPHKTMLTFGISAGDKVMRVTDTCTLAYFLRSALRYGSRHGIYYNDRCLMFSVGRDHKWYVYKVLDKNLFSVLAQDKLWNRG